LRTHIYVPVMAGASRAAPLHSLPSPSAPSC
jgi:hypothetical protein